MQTRAGFFAGFLCICLNFCENKIILLFHIVWLYMWTFGRRTFRNRHRRRRQSKACHCPTQRCSVIWVTVNHTFNIIRIDSECKFTRYFCSIAWRFEFSRHLFSKADSRLWFYKDSFICEHRKTVISQGLGLIISCSMSARFIQGLNYH